MQKFSENTKKDSLVLSFVSYYFINNLFLLLFLGSNSEAQAFLQRDGQVIIRMRGLPFDATARDVVSISHACIALCA